MAAQPYDKLILASKARTLAYTIGDETILNELAEHDLYKLNPLVDDDRLDIAKHLAPTNSSFETVAYSDASFAV